MKPSFDSTGAAAGTTASGAKPNTEPTLGHIFRDAGQLSAEQVDRIVQHQRQHGMRFGEAAVALGLVDADAVMRGLSRQYQYPYATAERRRSSPELVMLHDPLSAQAEAVRALRAQLALQTVSTPKAPALAVVSPDSGDGRTWLAANLAVAMAQTGDRVLLVEADLRRPRLHQVLGLDAPSAGLARALARRAEEPGLLELSDVPGLHLMTAGPVPPNPLELLEGRALTELLQVWSHRFDRVVVDTPAAGQGADATVLAARCGSAVLIARRHRSRLDNLRALQRGAELAGVRWVGVVHNAH